MQSYFLKTHDSAFDSGAKALLFFSTRAGAPANA